MIDPQQPDYSDTPASDRRATFEYVPADAQLVVVHKGLAKVAHAKAPNAVVLAFDQFLNDPVVERLVKAMVEKTEIVSNVN